MNRRRFVALIGSALAAPLVRAQRPARMVRLGYLSSSLVTLRTPQWEPFFVALSKLGWREGVEYSLEPRESRGDPERALASAKDLVAQRVDLLLAISTGAALAAKRATDRIPIVSWLGYPVEAGLAESLAHPAGNVTGVANYASAEVWGKFIELLRELRPGLRELGVLWDYAPPGFPDGHVPLPVIEKSAQQMEIKARIWMVRSEKDLNEALSAIERGRIEAIMMTNGGGIHIQPALADRIGELFARRRLPAIVDVASAAVFERAGCVLAYSPNVPELLGRLAHFVDRILRGANPGELPFELPSRFDLAINMKAAKVLGLTIPQSLLLRADRVIE